MASLPSVAVEPRPTPRAAMSHQKKQYESTAFRRILSFASTTDKTAHARLRPRALISFLVVLLFSTSLFDAVAAQPHGPRLPPVAAVSVQAVKAVEPDLAWIPSSLILDTRPPPQVALFMPPLSQDQDATKTLSAPPSKRSLAVDSKNTSPSFTVPRPFDTGLSNNFTSACATFLNRMLKNDAFNQCHPFSLMLETSDSFFDVSKSYLRITQTLDATCGVDSAQCTATLDNFARQMVLEDACKIDYHNDNPVVLQAYNGLVAYKPAYQASCLRDDKGSYCFANAVSNSTSPSDSVPFRLPIGQQLPGGARPTCNSCLQDAMAIFANFANNSTQPLSRTYAPAAQQLAIGCGSSFINVPAAPLKAAASTLPGASLTPTLALILIFLVQFFT
jgi:hypothetical protein